MQKKREQLTFLKKLWNRRMTIFWLTVIAGLFIGAFWVGGAYLVWTSEEARVVRSLEKYQKEIGGNGQSFQPKPILIRDRAGIVTGEFYRRSFKPIRVDNLNKHRIIIWALLSSEDREFFVHSGVNYVAIIRALVANITQLRLSQGGSTISQQLAKLTLNLGKRNLSNKLTELYATFYIESRFSKEEILAMYLNQIFLGENNTGVEEASRYYFRKPASELTYEEAALIVGIIPAPSLYNPMRNLKIALNRQKRVLSDMAKNPELSQNPKFDLKKFTESMDSGLKKFYIQYKVKETKVEDDLEVTSEIGKFGANKDFRINLSPDFNAEIRNFVLETFSDEDLDETSLEIFTTLDIEKQRIAESALRYGIDEVRKEIQKEIIKDKNKSQEFLESLSLRMTGAMVALDPLTGDIEALVGGYKISNSYQINRVEESRRQPGSTIKALVYALAFEKRIINPSSLVIDRKLNIAGYSPKNWYKGFRGEMTARQALAQSVNTVSVTLLNEIGLNYFLDKLGKILSLSDEQVKERFSKNLSLALGSGELSPMELAIVYATLANGGRKVTPRKILKIVAEDGREIFVAPELQDSEQIIDPVAAAMALNTLESVLSGEGTMQIKQKEGEKLLFAGKTGTVQSPKSANKKWGGLKGVRDTWFSGILPRHVTVVWVGHDEGAPFPGSGSGVAGSIWVKYVREVNAKIGFGTELIPSFVGDFVRIDVCGDDGTVLEKDPTYVCKFPLLAQYYYIGDLPKKRSGFNQASTPQPTSTDAQGNEPESEISKYDIENEEPESPDAVELEPPLIIVPKGKDTP